MKKALLVIALLPGIACAAQQNLIYQTGTSSPWKTEGKKIHENFTDLYTNKPNTSCFANAAAFNTCFTLDWQSVDASGFNGNLTATDDTLQEIAQKVDDLVLGSGSGATAINDLTDVDTTGKATGKILKFDASGNLVVGDDEIGASGTGDIEGVTASTGLTGGGTTGTVALSIDPTYVQRRVSSSCSAGTSIRAIAEDGTVTCETDDTGTGSVPSGTVNGQVLTWSTDQWVAGTASWLTTESLGTGVATALGFAPDATGGFATKVSLDLKANSTGISFVAGALSDMKILTTAQPSTGENMIDDTVSYGATEDNLRLWSIDKIGSQLAGKIGTAGVTYEQLNTNGDVGTSSGQLAIGNHTHSGVYQPADAELDAWDDISPTTGSINTTGSVQGKVPLNSYSTAQTLTAATHNSTIVQMTVAAEVTMWDCETANIGDTVMLWARDAEKIEVVPASGDQFYLFDGTGIGANDELDVAATAGTKVTLMCTADDTWSVYSETAASVDGGVAD